MKQAIAKRDAGAIAKAVKSVNDSKAAKEKADSEAKAKAEQEAQAQAAAEAAAQAQAQTQQSYSAPRQSYTPSYSAPQQSYTPRIRAVRHRVVAPAAACRTSFQQRRIRLYR